MIIYLSPAHQTVWDALGSSGKSAGVLAAETGLNEVAVKKAVSKMVEVGLATESSAGGIGGALTYSRADSLTAAEVASYA